MGESTPRRILLIGMMGAGKTTVGELLAERLGWPYFDSDIDIERRTGRSVTQIFATSGEAAFRAEETKALARAATGDGPGVISVAGGAVLAPENRHTIRAAGLVVWLRAEVETLAGRVGDGHDRPLLRPDPAAALRRLYAERRPVYEELADLVVDVDGLSPVEIVDRIVTTLEHARA